jgi:nucleoside-diphosphate-sugar epimerase
VHVRDVARALCIMLEADDRQIAGEVFNVGDTTQNFRKLDIVDLLRQRFPTANIEFVHRDEDPRDYRVSFEKFRNRFAFCSSRTVADGIDEVVRLVRSGLVADPYAASYRN